MTGGKTQWTEEMLQHMRDRFPYDFNIDLSKALGVSPRTITRKAREMNLDKEDGFLDKNRETITKMATAALPEPWNKGISFTPLQLVPTQFKKGCISAMKDPEVAARATATRNETIRVDRIRRKYGMSPITKLNLKY